MSPSSTAADVLPTLSAADVHSGPRSGSPQNQGLPSAPKVPPLPELVPQGERATSVRVRVPLSVANVGPGFDHFGLCLEGPSDVLELRASKAAGLEVYGDALCPRDLRRNVATVAASELYRQRGLPFRVQARLFKGYRGGSGIGSSGASAVAGALAAAALLGLDAEDERTAALVLAAALRGERAASGGRGHLDNIAASLFGGFTLVERSEPPIVHRIAVPDGLRVVVALPRLLVPTRHARTLLPPTVTHAVAVASVARASALIHGLLTGDLVQVGRNLKDELAEPYRERLVPGLREAEDAARAAGAWGAALSGSGPAVFALAPAETAAAVAEGLRQGFDRAGVKAEAFVGRTGTGAVLTGWS